MTASRTRFKREMATADMETCLIVRSIILYNFNSTFGKLGKYPQQNAKNNRLYYVMMSRLRNRMKELNK